MTPEVISFREGSNLFRIGRFRMYRVNGVYPKSTGVMETLYSVDAPVDYVTRNTCATYSGIKLGWLWIINKTTPEIGVQYSTTYNGTVT